MIQRFAENTAGRDFVVGDIHGCFALLEAELAKVAFDPSVDRLFSVGDLVDRGPESERALEFLDKPWFHAVRGNHEAMAIDYLFGRVEARDYAANGGSWFIGKTREERMRYAVAFHLLPLALEVESAGRVFGIVHADCPFPSWEQFRAAMAVADDLEPGRMERIEMMAMWSRDRASLDNEDVVAGVDVVVVGHTPMQRVSTSGTCCTSTPARSTAAR